MLRFVLLFNLILCPLVISKRKSHKDSSASVGDLGGHLVSSLRNDVNIDLPEDEEYEDLRAELLAYHTALASITNQSGRRSMKTTPCWQLGGICVDHRLCEGHRFLTEVNGCRDKLEVCCFTWNNYNVRDMRDKGIGFLAMPWSQQQEIGGKGILNASSNEKKRKKLKKKRGPDHHDHDSSHYDNKHYEMTDRDNLYHDKHHVKDHHDKTHLEKPHHENPHHEKSHHEKSHHVKSHHEKPQSENPPIVVILRTKKRNNYK